MADITEILSYVWGTGAGATFGQTLALYDHSLLKVELRSGTRCDLQLDPGGLFFVLEPGLHVTFAKLSSMDVTTLRYSFEEAKFHVETGTSILGPLRDHFFDQFLNLALLSKLPDRVRNKNYAPKDDPDLAGTLAQLQGALPASSGSGPSPEALLGILADPSGYLQLELPTEMHVPLADGIELYLPQNAQIYVAAAADGGLASPTIREVWLKGQKDALTIRSTGDGIVDAFTQMTMKKVTIAPGGQFTFEYDLLIEDILSAGVGLVRLLGIAATGDLGNAPDPDVTLGIVREKIDALLQKEVPPQFKGLLQQYDRVIPGISLLEAFGI